MTPEKILLVLKILQLSQSDNDAEALAACRKANAILKGAGITWQQFFTKAMAPVPQPQRPQPQSQGAASRFYEQQQAAQQSAGAQQQRFWEEVQRQQSATQEELRKRTRDYLDERRKATERKWWQV